MNFLNKLFAQGLIKKEEVKIPTTEFGPDKTNLVLNVIFGVIGGVALIVLILAGIKFMTSQGNPDGIAKARNTIIYAAIGLVVSVSALSIVNLVLGRL